MWYTRASYEGQKLAWRRHKYRTSSLKRADHVCLTFSGTKTNAFQISLHSKNVCGGRWFEIPKKKKKRSKNCAETETWELSSGVLMRNEGIIKPLGLDGCGQGVWSPISLFLSLSLSLFLFVHSKYTERNSLLCCTCVPMCINSLYLNTQNINGSLGAKAGLSLTQRYGEDAKVAMAPYTILKRKRRLRKD